MARYTNVCVNVTVSQDFCFWFFSLIIFPQASQNSIRVISIFFDNSRRYLHVKGHQLYQRHRNKFATGVNDTSGKFATNTAGVVDIGSIIATQLILAANLPPVSTSPVECEKG
jgi:hypothetical protein